MHDDEVLTDSALAGRLLAGQFPRWAGLRLTPVESSGTDHDVYRLGDHLAVRLPRIAAATGQAALEREWLPRLAPHLPLAVPVQLATGHPAEGYPFGWSVYEWLPGTDVAGTLHEPERAAADLAGFVAALRRIDTAGAPQRSPGSRGGRLADRDDGVRRAIAELGDGIDGIDGDAALRSWRRSLDAGPWTGDDVWIHGDLLPGNLLAVDGRLSAVIDFACLTVGDPAADLIPAWSLFTGAGRARFRAGLGDDDATWQRGRGWALSQAAVALPYYRETNPGLAGVARRALRELLTGDGA
jgi:aminoglycoside phosphotransferase (APT) family kinase protein